ncbi:MAG: hypothetical protein K6A64_02580 [Bacteroidales bacterium]|nr:hypothetical protein [Bacteroidales bacterium]
MKTKYLLSVLLMACVAAACSKEADETIPENHIIFGDITRTIRSAGMDPVSCTEFTKDKEPWLEFVISWASTLQIALINEQEYIAIAIPSTRLDEEIDLSTFSADSTASWKVSYWCGPMWQYLSTTGIKNRLDYRDFPCRLFEPGSTLKVSHKDVLTWQIDLDARFDAEAFERNEDYYMNIYHKGEIMDLKCHYLGKPEVVYLLPPNLRKPTF